MVGINPVRWRTGIDSGINVRHQPLWSWLGANPVANRPRTFFGPILALVLWLLGLCCLCLMMLWIQSPQQIVVLQFVAGYQTNLGVTHNVGGIRFADQLLGLRAHQANKGLITIKPTQIVRKNTDLTKIIGQTKSQLLVINFCMHGAMDENGPYLIPDDAEWSPETENRIHIDELLQILRNQPESQTKIVLFDASQMESLWSFGVIDNHFSHGLAQLDQKIRDIPNLIVVNSCQPKEYSWMIHNLGISNFATQFLKCISGGTKDLNLDGQIDLSEVLAGLKLEVSSWASINRNSSQTIMILPNEELSGKLLAKALVCQAGSDPVEPDFLGPIGAISELRDAWQHFDHFQSSHLSPQQICPELWNVYQKTILRYEALLRVGDVSNALTMRQQLGTLDSRIKTAMQLPLDSSGNSLFYGSIIGQDYQLDENTLKLASELLASAQGELNSKLKDYVENTPTSLDKVPPRIMLQWAIMRQAAKSSNPNPDRLSYLLDQLYMPGRIACLESHALRLYLRDRPTDSDAYTALPQWINTRLLAEFASCGMVNPDSPTKSPQRGAVFYFNQIAEADSRRQLAQDRLLSSNKEHRVEASRDLVRLRDVYIAIAEKAKRSADGLNRHNSITSILPFYTQWVVRLSSPMNPTSDNFAKELGGKIQSVWNNLHAANEELQKAVNALCANADPQPFLDKFSDFTMTAETQFLPVRAAYRRQCEALSAADIFGREMILDDVLLVPDGDNSLRMSLLENNSSKSPKQVGVNTESYWVKRPPIERSNNTSFAGQLALALVGKAVFDDNSLIPGMELDSFDQTTDRMKNFMLQPDSGAIFLSKAGAQISLRLGRLQNSVKNLLALTSQSKPEAILPLLVKAEQISRIASFSLTDNDENPEAGILLRRGWVNHFLVQQAKRSWTEHLYNFRPIATPSYYQFAMTLALGDASKGPVPVGLSETLDLSIKNGELEIQRMIVAENGERKATTATNPWTTEKTFQIEFEAGPRKGGAIPPGFVQLEVLPGPETIFAGERSLARREINLKPADLSAGGVERNSVWVELSSPLVDRGQDPTAPIPLGKNQSLLKATALFRGQRIPVNVPFDLHNSPPLVVSKIAMGGPATLALRATNEVLANSGQANGNVAIVVDCSGSMGPTAESPGKIAEVAKALETVLGKLPQGVNVSVWIFGQAIGPGKTVENPEDYIQLLSGPALLGPDPSGFASRLARKFRSGEITPWNQSPLISAMSKAAKSLTGPGSQPGPSTLLVLTDGKDNRASEDKILNPGNLSIPTLVVKLFAGTGIQVRVIGFQAGMEDPMVKADFESLGQLDPPGGYSSVGDLQELISVMDRSLRREFRFQIETPTNQLVANQPPGGYEASMPGFSDRWILPGIPPGEYLLRSGNLKGPLGVVRLQPSDKLLIGLSKDQLPRRLGMVDELKGRPKGKSAGWSMGIGQNKLENQAIRMMGVLEKDWDPGELELAQIKPGMTWWEWIPQEGLSAPVRIWPEIGHSPVWTLFSPIWPKSPVTGGPSQGSLKVWWSPDKSFPFVEEFNQGSDFRVITDLANKPMIVDGKNCLLESVKSEEREVMIEPGKVAKRKCLVVRVRGPIPEMGTQPLGLALASIDGFSIEGEEQIVNSEVGRVASVFWPIDDKKLMAIKKIQFRSLKKFKDEAMSRGYFMNLDRLGSPDPNDERPRQTLPFVPSTFMTMEQRNKQLFNPTGANAP